MAQLFENDPIKRHATFSDDRVFRYTLMRTWGTESKCCFVMLNPSIADASIDDPTIRRCMGFAKAWGHGGLIVVNLFAFRSTDPQVMIAEHKKGGDIIGPANDLNIIMSCKTAARVVAAWGAHGSLAQRSAHVRKMLGERDIKVECLGLTKLNEPQHPLYIEGDRPLQPLPDLAPTT